MDKNHTTLTGRIKRYASVSTKLSNLAMKLAKFHYLEGEEQSYERAKELKDTLGDLKGPLMKVAQLLATVPDLLPPEFAQELMQLQSLAPPMGRTFVKRRMKGELGPDWPSKFKDFNQEASAAASLGQVHKATHLDGQELACKLQYPDMKSVVSADLQQLKVFLKIMDTYGQAIQSDEIHKEISERLMEELDYIQEAKHVCLYRLIHEKTPFVHIPEVLPELSTDRLLTMTWLSGKPLLDCVDLPKQDRNTIAKHMFHIWYKPFYHYGVIHGDPHLGNYTVRDDLSVNLLDFGCVRLFSPSFVQGVLDLYHALSKDDQDLAVEAYRKWGFKKLDKDLIGVLNQWAKFLYAPIMDNRVRPIDETKSGVYGKEIAGKIHKELRRVGGVTPPKEFVFMDRAAIGLGSVFLHLNAEINWYEEFHTLVEGFSEKKLENNQKASLKACNL